MNATANDSGAGNSYVLNLVGAGAMYQDFVPDMVDMSAFGGNPGDPVAFDCVFVINLD